MSNATLDQEWLCEVCLTANDSDRQFCDRCWAPREEAALASVTDIEQRWRRRLREKRIDQVLRVLVAVAALALLWAVFGARLIGGAVPRPSSAVGVASSPGAWATEGYDAANSFAPQGGGPIPERVAWIFPIEGGQAAAPVVAHGTAYLATKPGRLVAIDAQNGDVRWETQAAGPVHGSPVVTDQAVILAQAPGTVVGFSPQDGSKLWEISTGRLVFASPVIHEGVLFLASVERKLLAIDVEEEVVLWQADLQRAVHRPPAVDAELIALSADFGTLDVVDRYSGELRFSFGPGRGALVQSPLLIDGMVIVARGGRVIAVDSASVTGWIDRQLRFWKAQLFAWRLRSSPPEPDGLLWSRLLSDAGVAGIAARDGAVYVATRDGGLYALDAASGEVLWEQSARGATTLPPVAGSRYVYVGTQAGHIAVFDRQDGTPLASIEVGIPVDGSLILAEGSLFALSSTGEALVAVRP